jgi:hypothetical protein
MSESADGKDAVIALADALAESSERECGHAGGGYPLKDWAVLMCCPRCVCRYCAAEVAREHAIALVKAVPQREWDKDDADSAEARSARAYGSGLADAIKALQGGTP